ncbi:hypothetical protein SAMN05216338_10637 [Bradyrhizobium sp. Rc2d]|uniref:hypothetical protein n=1 Tax=Bradyrhizobium sp. Rc2d TaxID=1855321 RepID=UPI00088DDAA3|nr:hypothetical protein [Bradyrhizobium sp. Rc2d]SDJ73957.1 hypothetical protein SAMN05216338_10637 [Bradyrhizobium sp. Rc2d]
MPTSKTAEHREVGAKITDQESAIKQLLRRAANGTRPFSVVPHARETDANREFGADRDADAVVWFLIALPIFMIAHAMCVKIGAI